MTNKTILLVDDDTDYVFQIKTQLERAGYNVLEAYDMDEALAQCRTTKPDLAIIDLMMKQMDDGFVLAFKLKKIHAALPIILATAVTGHTGLEFESIKAEEKNWIKADVVLSKPVRFDQLLFEIERLIA